MVQRPNTLSPLHTYTQQVLLQHGTTHTTTIIITIAHTTHTHHFRVTSFYFYVQRPNTQQVLLQHGADVLPRNARPAAELSPAVTAAGSTPLHLAAARGHVEICRILLKTFVSLVFVVGGSFRDWEAFVEVGGSLGVRRLLGFG